MKREDFKKITDDNFKACEIIIENDGACIRIGCGIGGCPFSFTNASNGECCGFNRYITPNVGMSASDNTLLESAKEFLKFREIKLSMHVFGIETKKIYLVSQRIDDVLIGITPDGDKIAFDENGFSLENKEKKVVTTNLEWREYIKNALYKCKQEESGLFIREDIDSMSYYYKEYTQGFHTTETIFGVNDGYDIDTVIDLLNICGVFFEDFMELVSEL